jgi:hypothetical protein
LGIRQSQGEGSASFGTPKHLGVGYVVVLNGVDELLFDFCLSYDVLKEHILAYFFRFTW